MFGLSKSLSIAFAAAKFVQRSCPICLTRLWQLRQGEDPEHPVQRRQQLLQPLLGPQGRAALRHRILQLPSLILVPVDVIHLGEATYRVGLGRMPTMIWSSPLPTYRELRHQL